MREAKTLENGMLENRIIDAIHFLDEEMLAEAFEVRESMTSDSTMHNGQLCSDVACNDSKSKKWYKVIVAVAAVCLLSIGIIDVMPIINEVSEDEVIYGETFSGIGGGTDIITSQVNLSFADYANPWMQNDAYIPAKLPVYKNLSYSLAGEPSGLTDDQMVGLLVETAESLGLEITKIEKEYNPRNPDAVFCCYTTVENTRIEVEADGLITIVIQDDAMSDKPAELYFSLLGFEEPVSTKDIDGNWIIFDGKGTIVEDMLNYFFSYANFYNNEEENKEIIRIHNKLMAAEKLGDYFYISVEAAKEKLYKGEFYTNSGYGIYENSRIAKCDLVYRNSRTDEYYMPYYCFCIEIEDEHLPNGYNYGLFYVPAVELEVN